MKQIVTVPLILLGALGLAAMAEKEEREPDQLIEQFTGRVVDQTYVELCLTLKENAERSPKTREQHCDLVECGKTVSGKTIHGFSVGNTNNCIALIGYIHPEESGAEIMLKAVKYI